MIDLNRFEKILLTHNRLYLYLCDLMIVVLSDPTSIEGSTTIAKIIA